MSLATLHHVKMASVTVTSSTMPNILDNIYTCITAANDHNGVAVPAGTALTVTKYQNVGVTEALYGTFGAGSALTPKFLIAGVNAARTPLMGINGSHTWTANMLMGSINKNAGAFATWDHATQPFTSGQPGGLIKFFNVASITASRVYATLTAETIDVFIESSTGTIFWFGCGARLDPESTAGNSAESDGRVYSQWSTGTTQLNAALGTSVGYAPGHSAGDNSYHFLTFTPGAATMRRTSRLSPMNVSTTTTLTTPDGEPVALPIFCYDTVNDRFIGRMREVRHVRDAKFGQKQAPASVDAWFYVSASLTADGDALGFLA